MKKGYIEMPESLTAENGAKSLLNGAFFETVKIPCLECDMSGWLDEEAGEECHQCNGYGEYTEKVPVSWTTIKEIYAMAVKHFTKAQKHHISGAGPPLHTQKEIAALWDKHTQRRKKK